MASRVVLYNAMTAGKDNEVSTLSLGDVGEKHADHDAKGVQLPGGEPIGAVGDSVEVRRRKRPWLSEVGKPGRKLTARRAHQRYGVGALLGTRQRGTRGKEVEQLGCVLQRVAVRGRRR